MLSITGLLPRPLRLGLGTVLLLTLGLACPPSAHAQNHLWTDSDGRRYDAAPSDLYNDQVTFRRVDGSTFTLPLDDLIPDDQQAIHDWFYRQPKGVGEAPPPTQRLSPWGRTFVLDTPRVLRLRPFANKGYASAFLAVPLTIRNDYAGPVDFVNLYLFDVNRKARDYPLIPPDGPLMIQANDTTAFVRPADFKVGQTYNVLFPLQDPSARTATYIVAVAGNDLQAVSIVYPSGSWRDFDFPQRAALAADKYSDFSAQELYPEKTPADLFQITDVTRLVPLNGDHAPNHDFFRLALQINAPLPAAALSAQWYAFDKQHRLLRSVGQPPYAQTDHSDISYLIVLPGHGPVDITDPVLPTPGDVRDTLQLPGAAAWDQPDIDTLVFAFGTETKKVARVFSKSGAKFADLPVPEKSAFGDASIATETKIPTRTY